MIPGEMVAKNSPVWPPSGWSVEYKALENGRMIEYYANFETGQKFYSKEELIRYLSSIQHNPFQTIDNDNESSNPPQEVNTQLSEPSKEEQFQVVLNPSEIPEWLPEGWIMALKTSQNDSATENEQKCYVNPSTGHKFYSKTDVFEYLKSVNHAHSSEDVAVEEIGRPEWLPKGWTVERRTYDSGSKRGTRYKRYVELSTQHNFFSKPQVLRYLESLNDSSTKKDFDDDDHDQHVVLEENETPKWLPDGWTVEVRTRKSGPKVGEKRKCYIDPSTGRKFMSRPQVYRYLKAQKRKNRSFKQKHIDNGEHPPENASGKKVVPDELPPGWVLEIRIKGKRRDPYYTDPVTGIIFRSRLDVNRYLEKGKISKHALKPKNRVIKDSDTITDEVGTSSEAKPQESLGPVTKPQLNEGDENLEVGEVTRASSETAGFVNPTTENIEEKHPPENSEGTSLKRKRTRTETTPDAKKISEITTEGSNTRRITRGYAKTVLASEPKTESSQEKLPLKHIDSGTETGGELSEAKDLKRKRGEDCNTPPDKKVKIVSELANKNNDNEKSVHGQFSNTINMLFEDQTDEPKNHVPNVESKKKEAGNQESGPSYAFGNSWTDSCIEFAFKTLTGALPIEDNHVVQNYVHQPSGITRGPQFNVPINPPFMPSGNNYFPSWKDISRRKPHGD